VIELVDLHYSLRAHNRCYEKLRCR